jgi:hypothetical protein
MEKSVHVQHFSLKLYQNSMMQYAIHPNTKHINFTIFDTWDI